MPAEVSPEEATDRKTESSSDKQNFIKTMYEQHWDSQRAGVKERLQLTYIFSGIFAGSLVILKENLIDRISLPLIVFLMSFSIFGILFTLKVEGVLRARETAANRIVDLYGLSDLNAKYDRSLWVTKVRIGRLFPIFFSMCFCFLLFILLNILFKGFIYNAAGISVVIFIESANYLWNLEV